MFMWILVMRKIKMNVLATENEVLFSPLAEDVAVIISIMR